jgi:hypothetical protein
MVSRVWQLVAWLFRATVSVCGVLLLGWATLAIHFSNLPWPWLRTALAAAFLVFGIWALWLTRRPRMRWVFAGVFLGVLAWWSTILPTHDREWRPDVGVMPRATINGDSVRLSGVRNFNYRTREDFDVRYVEREVSPSHLIAVDFYLSYWMSGPIGHTFVSFVFDNAPPLAVSIETRPEIGEGYSPIASLFKQYELIYVVGEERDLVGVRASHRDEDLFLYRLRISPDAARALFAVYLERINELADKAEFYHLLSNSCTVNIVRYANVAGRVGEFDIRHLLNGWIDRYFFDVGLIDTTLPFEVKRQQAHITEAAKAAATASDFSEKVRAAVPAMHQ